MRSVATMWCGTPTSSALQRTTRATHATRTHRLAKPRLPRASIGRDLDSFPEPSDCTDAKDVPWTSKQRTSWTKSLFFSTCTPQQREKRLEIARYKRLVVHLLHRIDALENDLKAPSFSDDNDMSTDF